HARTAPRTPLSAALRTPFTGKRLALLAQLEPALARRLGLAILELEPGPAQAAFDHGCARAFVEPVDASGFVQQAHAAKIAVPDPVPAALALPAPGALLAVYRVAAEKFSGAQETKPAHA